MLSSSVRDFILYCSENKVISFNTDSGFVLKSGRIAPWYFNAGNLMQHAEWLSKIAKIFVHTLRENFSDENGKLKADILYGAAYKWIPLAAVVAQEYAIGQGWKNIDETKGRLEVL
jgi:orotate phosphoribosyltransferase